MSQGPAINVSYPSGLLTYMGDLQSAAKVVEAELKQVRREQAAVIAQGRQIDSKLVARTQALETQRRELRGLIRGDREAFRSGRDRSGLIRGAYGLATGGTAQALARGELGRAAVNSILQDPRAVGELADKLIKNNTFSRVMKRAGPALALAAFAADQIAEGFAEHWRENAMLKQLRSRAIRGEIPAGELNRFMTSFNKWHWDVDKPFNEQKASEAARQTLQRAYAAPSKMQGVLKVAKASGVEWRDLDKAIRSATRAAGRPLTDKEQAAILDKFIESIPGETTTIHRTGSSKLTDIDNITSTNKRASFIEALKEADSGLQNDANKPPTVKEQVFRKYPFLRKMMTTAKIGRRKGAKSEEEKRLNRLDEQDSFDLREGMHGPAGEFGARWNAGKRGFAFNGQWVTPSDRKPAGSIYFNGVPVERHEKQGPPAPPRGTFDGNTLTGLQPSTLVPVGGFTGIRATVEDASNADFRRERDYVAGFKGISMKKTEDVNHD